MLLCGGFAGAAAAPSGFSLSGYGSLGFTQESRGDTAFVRDLTQRPKGADGAVFAPQTRPWLTDSGLGLQAMYRFGPELELVTQFHLRDQEVNDLDTATQWAFVGLHPIPEFDLRLGRVGYDAFLMSDYRHVAYAYPWARPPLEFYSWLPVYSLDGLDFVYRIEDADGSGGWNLKSQLGVSSTHFPLGPNTYEFEGDILTLSISREAGPWRIRAGYSLIQVGSEIPLTELHAGLDAIAALGIPGISHEAADLRHNMSYEGAELNYYTLGASYDDGVWLAQGELGLMDASADMVSNGTAAYLSVGRRFGDWTPFVTASHIVSRHAPRQAATDWGVIGQSGLQQLALGIHNSTRFDQSGLSLGVRWDVHPQAALKLQWDHYFIEGEGHGLWWTAKDRSRDAQIDVLSLTLDFVF